MTKIISKDSNAITIHPEVGIGFGFGSIAPTDVGLNFFPYNLLKGFIIFLATFNLTAYSPFFPFFSSQQALYVLPRGSKDMGM